MSSVTLLVGFISANKSKVYYGIPPEPDLGVVIEDESEDDEDKDKPKVKTMSKQYWSGQNNIGTSLCICFTLLI